MAAPAAVNLTTVSMSLEMALVWKLWLGISEVVRQHGAAELLQPSAVSVAGLFSTPAESDQLSSGEVLLIKEGMPTC